MDHADFTIIWNKYLAKTATEEEVNAMLDFINTVEGQKMFLDLSLQISTEDYDEIRLADKDWEFMRSNIKTKILRARIVIFRRSLLKYAAAVILLFGTGIYFYQSFVKKPVLNISRSVLESNNILPGGNRAILVLGDESVINLDSATEGQLASQGPTSILKTKDGGILYTQNGKSSSGEIFYQKLITPKGGQYQVTLSDGTQVWLNAASSIRFPNVFNETERTVEITGEVYFDVAKDKNKPFRVNANNKVFIDVLGTGFNVNCYENENNIVTTLLEGSVQIERGDDRLILKPGQQAEAGLKNNSNITLNPGVDADQVIAWKNGLFNFEGSSLSEVMRQLERWYDIEVIIEKDVPAIEFMGKLSRSISFKDLLEILEGMQIKYHLEGERKLIITR